MYRTGDIDNQVRDLKAENAELIAATGRDLDCLTVTKDALADSLKKNNEMADILDIALDRIIELEAELGKSTTAIRKNILTTSPLKLFEDSPGDRSHKINAVGEK